MALNTDKLNYSIGQVADMAGVAQSTLRYWETVIDVLKPQKTAGGSRRYNKETVELVMRVKDLLHDQGLTIKGANLYLEKHKDTKTADNANLNLTDTVKTSDHEIAETDNTKKDFQFVLDELLKIDRLLE
jgi:DNA-binding transcriptional MerR regulator